MKRKWEITQRDFMQTSELAHVRLHAITAVTPQRLTTFHFISPNF